MKKNWKEMADTEIKTQLEETRKSLRQLRFDFAVTRSLQNPREIRTLKKKVARLLTLKRERQLQQKGK